MTSKLVEAKSVICELEEENVSSFFSKRPITYRYSTFLLLIFGQD